MVPEVGLLPEGCCVAPGACALTANKALRGRPAQRPLRDVEVLGELT